ncbi:alpha/beta hydrolase [Pseudaeromonas sp. ZJS20]|uniref:alpha/beta hydrolase n=1 Tax=Pseudaeromonas aegiceratis TaxID=3153928 RepID=UPI00390CAAD8
MLASFTHQGVELRYYDNQADGPVLVFQHGLAGDHRQILEIFPPDETGAPGFRLICLECRGHGGSALGPGSALCIPQFAADLLALLTWLRLPRVHLAGISFGAALVAALATKMPHKVTSLSLIRPAWLAERNPPNLMIFNVALAFLQTHGPLAGQRLFCQSGAYQALAARSADNARSVLALFAHPHPQALDLFNRLTLGDPGLDLAALGAAPWPIQVLGTPQDEIHPLPLAETLAQRLGLTGIVCLPAKSADVQGHYARLRDSLLAQLFA